MEDDDDRPTTDSAAHETRADGGPTARDHRLGPGTEIGGYIIDGEVGKGGMGFVYSATHPVIGKRAAIKILKPDVSRSPIVLERFIQEARAVNQIGHPNIIDIFAFGQLPDGRAYHIMDLLVGESLRKRLRRGPLHPSEAASVIDEIASALIAAHDKGFVHRDLKPDNVFLVDHDGRWPEVKLLDFGLAKLMPEAGTAPFKTKTGVMLGTPEYMSPEQARGIGVDYRTDVYALGVLTFEILAGVRPFPSLGDSFRTLQAHAEEPPPSIADLVPALPIELVQLVAAMLAKDPGARPSLAAVRTVIKRLRTTQLPSRTAAGLEALSLPPAPPPVPGPLTDPAPSSLAAPPAGASPFGPASLAPPPAGAAFGPAPSLGDVRPSRLGAEPLIPGEPPQVATAPLIDATAAARMRPASASSPPSYPPPPQPPPVGSAASIPLPSPGPGPGPAGAAAPIAQPRSMHAPAASTHGSGSGSSPGMPLAPVPPQSSPSIRPPQASGLAGSAPPPIAGTVLGVGVPSLLKPPPATATTPVAAAASAPARTPSAAGSSGSRPRSEGEPRTSGVLLVVGALVAIGAGIAIALVVLDKL